jgi:ribosomal protein S18 acetylase RimI-like enzyme
MSRTDPDAVLDDPVFGSLAGRHADLGLRSGRAARYRREVSLISALEQSDKSALADLAAIVEPEDVVFLLELDPALIGSDWRVVMDLRLIQMVCRNPAAAPDTDLLVLGDDDVDEMLELVAATQPGPFAPRTIEMGTYLGVREGGRLIAMAGERMKPEGYTEVSGVCTDPEFRGRRLAETLVRAVTGEIQARGEVAFLHVMEGSPSQTSAVSVYERIGFWERRRVMGTALQRV